MKKINTLGLAVLLAGFISLMIGCNNSGPDKNPEVKFEATLTGANEVPRVVTSATGRLDGVYNKDTRKFSYSISYSGLVPTAGHIHFGNGGETGNVIYPFTSLTSPITGTWDVDPKYESALFSGILYANLHTVANKGGEIRSQIVMVDYNLRYGTK